MARHRKPPVIPTVTLRARRQLAACLTGASALTATFLSLTVTPAAPAAPDRAPTSHTSPGPQAAP
ncbi:hypothetical protein [Streptomyces chattanoogensis]|uniref:Uncharacterized protein n=1 Tax=Streptomyces chattanoogensis TaxID=66876 RepID=A0A0N1JVN4_9ACTN|nr:hypothetical protein [Streptomyces chattanoogensis]KPC58838.1 hypothetical protein ADL29_37210 [Streptomyces chattanoogensis]